MDEQDARRLCSFAEEAGRGLRGPDAGVWRERLQRRSRDLEVAFDWLLDHGHTTDALTMACTLAELLRIAGQVAAGRALLHRALEAAGTDDRRRAVALYEDGMLAFWQGADEEACAQHGRSLHLARRLDDATTVALALCGLARVALREDLDWARMLWRRRWWWSPAPATGSDAPTRCTCWAWPRRCAATWSRRATS
jgi:hypothetical protein